MRMEKEPHGGSSRIAVISALASVVVAVLSSQAINAWMMPQRVDRALAQLELVDSSVSTRMATGQEYVAQEAGIVFATVRAHPGERLVVANGWVDSVRVVTAVAQDLGVSPEVMTGGSIQGSSFTLPVQAGARWRVGVEAGTEAEVEVLFVSSRLQARLPSRE